MDLQTRIAFHGPVAVRYSKLSLPDPGDPGWGDYRHRDSGKVLRMIRIHGPFEVEPDHLGENRCDSGWLVLSPSGPYALYDDVQAATCEAVA